MDLEKDITYCQHEDKLIEYWKSINLYEQLITKKYPQTFNFIDGPPFVSGNLHYGHLGVSYGKSSILNYKRMNGYYCEDNMGNDCHGLPVELLANKELNLSTNKEVLAYGIDKYNTKCKKIIHKYSNSWNHTFDKLPRFTDYNNTYKTMDTTFMESVWWVFKQLWEKNLIYKSYRIVPFSIKCGTSLSNFEASQSYQDIDTMSLYVLFLLKEDPLVKLIAWTTTPWTLVSNISLCINAKEYYVYVYLDGITYIISEKYICQLFDIQKIIITQRVLGEKLKDLEYVPLFNYFPNRVYKVITDDFVQVCDEIGTGIVHIAPGFGEDDFRVCIENNIIKENEVAELCPIDENGNYYDIIKDFKGKNIFDSNKLIIKYLKDKKFVFKEKQIKHRYPMCPRTDTPIIYKAISSFFVKVTAIKDQLLVNNEKVTWIPEHIGKKRFHDWLLNVKDWGISRSRFFGTPIPIWVSPDGDMKCIGSIEALSLLTGIQNINDIHLDVLKDIKIDNYMLIGDVFDCWFESGCVPMGQIHYPFKNKNHVYKDYLSDLILEGLDQTRGWFYTLMVISTALFNKPAYNTVICTGLVLDKNGKKLSKRHNNFVDPLEVINKYGSDSLRLYMFNSPLIKAGSLNFNEEHIDIIKAKLIQLYNVVKFFMEHKQHLSKKDYYNCDNYNRDNNKLISNNIFDKWIISKTNTYINNIHDCMKNYQLDKVTVEILNYIEQLANWYVKFNRNRLNGKECNEQWIFSINTLQEVLEKFIIVTAPFIPFLSELFYQNICLLQTHKSVFLCDYPIINNDEIDLNIERQMELLYKVVSLIRKLRDKTTTHSSIKVPLKSITIALDENNNEEDIKYMEEYLYCEEINVLDVKYKKLDEIEFKFKVNPDNKLLGQKYKDKCKQILKDIFNINQEILKKIYYNEIDFVESNGTKLLKEELNVLPILNNKDEIIEDNIYVNINTIIDMEVENLNKIRIFIMEIQQLRKNAGLHPWDNIFIYYETNDNQLKVIINNYLDKIHKKISKPIYYYSDIINNTHLGNFIIKNTLNKIDVTIHIYFNNL